MRRGVPAALAATFILLLGLFAAPLAAQSTAEDGSDFEVLRVDLSTEPGLVAFRPQSSPAEEPLLSVSIEGETVEASSVQLASRSAVDQFTVLIVDNSETADTIAGFSQVQSAALAYLETVTADTLSLIHISEPTRPY